MNTITLFHTTKATLAFFDKQIEKQISTPVSLINMLDEAFAVVDRSKTQDALKEWRYNRLYALLKPVEAESDIIVVACSTLSLEVQRLKGFFSVPLLAIDDSLLAAVANEQRPITLFATSPNPVAPILEQLDLLSKGRKKIEQVLLCKEALPYLLANDMQKFRSVVLEFFDKNKPKTTLLLFAQGSSAFLKDEIAKCTGCTILTSIDYCINDIKSLLK